MDAVAAVASMARHLQVRVGREGELVRLQFLRSNDQPRERAAGERGVDGANELRDDGDLAEAAAVLLHGALGDGAGGGEQVGELLQRERERRRSFLTRAPLRERERRSFSVARAPLRER